MGGDCPVPVHRLGYPLFESWPSVGSSICSQAAPRKGPWLARRIIFRIASNKPPVCAAVFLFSKIEPYITSFEWQEEEAMMSKQSASLETWGKIKKGNASSSGLMAEGRCVQPGCQGFGVGRMHVESYARCRECCYQRKKRRRKKNCIITARRNRKKQK